MGFDESKDILVKQFERTDLDGKSVLFSVMKYGDGDPKLQITRMFQKNDGTVGYGKLGRMNKDELEYMKEILDNILEYMV